MNRTSAVIAYALVVIFFAVVFKYGLHLSFGVDPGYLGPIFIWHAIIIVAAVFKKGDNK